MLKNLSDGLEQINFPENVAAMQRDWLGRSEGAEITFKIEGSEDEITVFTTRPDTLFGVTFITLAPEHPLAEKLVLGTDFEDGGVLHDEVSVMAEFDRIKNMNKKKGVPLGKMQFIRLLAKRYQFGVVISSLRPTVLEQ